MLCTTLSTEFKFSFTVMGRKNGDLAAYMRRKVDIKGDAHLVSHQRKEGTKTACSFVQAQRPEMDAKFATVRVFAIFFVEVGGFDCSTLCAP